MSQITSLPITTAQITDLTAWAATLDPSIDVLEIVDVSANTSYKISRNQLLGISSNPLGLTDTQSPQNKTFDNTNAYTAKTNGFTLQDSADTTKQAKFVLSGNTTGTTRNYTFPNYDSTIATLAGTETFTNKTLTNPSISGGTIDNSAITVDSISGHTTPTLVSVGGLSISNGVLNTNNSVKTSNLQDQSVSSQKMKNGMVLYRQGGTSGVGPWDSPGTTNTQTQNYDSFIQVGSAFVVVDTMTITFPVAFTQRPIVILTCYVQVTKSFAILNGPISTTQFEMSVINTSGAYVHGEYVTWMAIGQ